MSTPKNITKFKEFLLSSWAIDHRTVIYVIMTIFFILGISAYFSMPREAFPEINDTKVFVSTIYPGNTAEDIERIVTDPLEEALKGVSNLVEIKSDSSEDFSVIDIEFDENISVADAKQKVKDLVESPKKLLDDNLLNDDYLIPSLSDLGLEDFEMDSRSAFKFKGGCNAAKERLEFYLWQSKKINFYKQTRNGLIGQDYSSKFSSWLSNGSISAREIFWEIKDYEKNILKNQSTYWLIFELIWRDFFKYISMKYGNKIFKIGGILEKDYQWSTDIKIFNKWVNGLTNEPFVNANMLELKYTGWMSNRGRQNVASYLAKELNLDWRWGARYFESQLIDYDVHSNYGNWMYVSGVGNDPRDRKFNIKFQAERYDPTNKYQKMWLQTRIF